MVSGGVGLNRSAVDLSVVGIWLVGRSRWNSTRCPEIVSRREASSSDSSRYRKIYIIHISPRGLVHRDVPARYVCRSASSRCVSLFAWTFADS